MYVEQDTSLLRRVAVDTSSAATAASGTSANPPVSNSLTVLLGGYKQVENGVQLPGTVRLLVGQNDLLSFTFDTFEVNKSIDAALFERPQPATTPKP
jgi:hypothetical protein